MIQHRVARTGGPHPRGGDPTRRRDVELLEYTVRLRIDRARVERALGERFGDPDGERRRLVGLAYRITGSLGDAEAFQNRRRLFDLALKIGVEVSAGDYGELGGSLVLNGPIESEIAAARLFVTARERDGFLDVNRGGGPRTDDEDSNLKFYTARGQLLLQLAPAPLLCFEPGPRGLERRFGLDLGRCAATGSNQALAYVSPKSGRAVSLQAGEPYRERLLRLPAFLTEAGGPPSAADVADGLKLTGFFLERHILGPRGLNAPGAREAIMARLAREHQ